MSAGVSSPLNDDCHYGLPRSQCTIGCGIQCRPARRAGTAAAAARIASEDASILVRLANEFAADVADAAKGPHLMCGTPDCCQRCT